MAVPALLIVNVFDAFPLYNKIKLIKSQRGYEYVYVVVDYGITLWFEPRRHVPSTLLPQL